MSEKAKERKSSVRIIATGLFILAGILLVLAITGYILRGTGNTQENLTAMRNTAVLHAATEGLVEKIAQEARADKLTELRKDKNFRKRGLDEVNAICDEAMNQAREEAEQKYSNASVNDPATLSAAVDKLAAVLGESTDRSEKERAVYSDLYIQLMESVVSWREIAPDNADDQQVTAELIRLVPDLDKAENKHLQAGFTAFARNMAEKEQQTENEENRQHALSLMTGSVEDWSAFQQMNDDDLWNSLTAEVPALAEYEAWKDDLTAAAKKNVETVSAGEIPQEQTAESDDGAVIASEALVDYSYFSPSDELTREQEEKAAAYQVVYDQLVIAVPDLSLLNDKLQASLQTNIENVVNQRGNEFGREFNTYAAHNGEAALTGSTLGIRLSALAKILLLTGIAVLLLGLTLFFWKKLSTAFGVPRTIITLFFIYLCLLAEVYEISVKMMLGNVLERMTMYGVLVLAMMPGIQCGIGLNMGMTIGCIAGLLGIVLSLQFNMVGFGALMFAVLCGVIIAAPLGWSYSKLLNRMKGNEMTISTYVGFSFVSLMCIGWMLLPFNNPKIIWLLSGRGLRVTHSLLGSFAHLLDNALSFSIFGIKIPTGGLLFLGVCCLMMWLFSRSRTGIALTAVGSNPRFAEASGISVNRMRTIGTVLSTIIAAVGIIIYSQAFGYAQLYTAPRQLGFIASSAILIGGATVRKAKVSHVLIGVFLFEGVLVFGQQIANSAVSGGGLSEVMRIMISNGIILYALTQSGGGRRE